MNRQTLIISVTLCILYSCSRSGHEDSVTSKHRGDIESTQQRQRPVQQPLTISAPKTSPDISISSTSSPKPVKEERIKGKVVETMNSGGYTYVAIATSSGETLWAAGRKTVVKVGEALDLKKEMEMTNFTSKTLGRTFKSIYFVSSLKVDPSARSRPAPRSRFPKLSAPAAKSRFPDISAPAAKSRFPDLSQRTHAQSADSRSPVHPSNSFGSGSTQLAPSGHSRPSVPKSGEISVTKARGGYTIAELFAQGRTLAGKEVLVRGKVVKFNSGIMDKNWVHIQDGTGYVTTNTHDLTVTSDQAVSVGDTVLVKGQLTVDRDIGAGYKYPVMIEHAKFSR
jgi:hypothetical protein